MFKRNLQPHFNFSWITEDAVHQIFANINGPDGQVEFHHARGVVGTEYFVVAEVSLKNADSIPRGWFLMEDFIGQNDLAEYTHI